MTAKVGAVAYQLQIPPHYRLHNTFHVGLLKPAFDNMSSQAPPPPVIIDGEEEFEVELILQHRPVGKTQGDQGIQYQVKWLGYGPEHTQWLPERNLTQTAPEVLQTYWDTVRSSVASGTGLAPGDQPSSPSVARNRGAKHRQVRPTGRRNFTRKISRASR